MTTSYESLLASAFFIGLAGSSFAIGAAFVSRWSRAGEQGTALGIFGLGLLGQSAAVFGGAVAAAAFGWQAVFRGVGVLLFAWAVVFALFARNNPARRPARRRRRDGPRAATRAARVVARRLLLPDLRRLRRLLDLPAHPAARRSSGWRPRTPGFRAAGFVVLATLMRPLGGWLADRIGGAQVLSWVFGGVAGFSLLLIVAVDDAVHRRRAWRARRCSDSATARCSSWCPNDFPRDTGTVTGLVGALGGLGGFFPPLLLGVFRDTLGVLWPGFVLLSADGAVPAHRESAGVSSRRRVVARVAAGGGAAGRRSRPRRRLGGGRDAAAGRGDRRRLAQPRALRRRAGRLHVRDAVRDLRHHLPLRDVARSGRRRGCTGGAAGRCSSARGFRRPNAARLGRRVVVEFAANRFIFRRRRCAAWRTG